MANTCFTSVTFFIKEDTKEAGEQLESFYKVLSDEDLPDLLSEWEVTKIFGIDPETVYSRGCITYVGELDENSFEIYDEDAWGPQIEWIDAVLTKYPLISYVYMAEESGMSVYVNTDKEGRFYDTRYRLSAEINGECFEEYLSCKAQIIETLNRWYGVSLTSVNEAEEFIEKTKEIYLDEYDLE